MTGIYFITVYGWIFGMIFYAWMYGARDNRRWQKPNAQNAKLDMIEKKMLHPMDMNFVLDARRDIFSKSYGEKSLTWTQKDVTKSSNKRESDSHVLCKPDKRPFDVFSKLCSEHLWLYELSRPFWNVARNVWVRSCDCDKLCRS